VAQADVNGRQDVQHEAGMATAQQNLGNIGEFSSYLAVPWSLLLCR